MVCQKKNKVGSGRVTPICQQRNQKKQQQQQQQQQKKHHTARSKI